MYVVTRMSSNACPISNLRKRAMHWITSSGVYDKAMDWGVVKGVPLCVLCNHIILYFNEILYQYTSKAIQIEFQPHL